MLRPDSPAVRAYYDSLRAYQAVGAAHEQAVKTAFHDVLQAAAGAARIVAGLPGLGLPEA